MTKIEIRGDYAYVFTPYNKDFIEQIKTIKGSRWNPEENAWLVPKAETDRVEDYLRTFFGEGKEDTVNIKVKAKNDVVCVQAPVKVFGITLCKATSAKSGASIVDDRVTLKKGRITSGGTAKNYCTLVAKDTVFYVRGVPKSVYERNLRQEQEIFWIDKLESKKQGKERIEQIDTEILKLKKRIAALEKERKMLEN